MRRNLRLCYIILQKKRENFFNEKKNVSQLGMDRNLTTFLYSDSKKRENLFEEKRQ